MTRTWRLLLVIIMAVSCNDSDNPAGPSGPNATFFVTSQTSVTGNLGGLAGADATCQRLAATAGFRGVPTSAWSVIRPTAIDRRTLKTALERDRGTT